MDGFAGAICLPEISAWMLNGMCDILFFLMTLCRDATFISFIQYFHFKFSEAHLNFDLMKILDETKVSRTESSIVIKVHRFNLLVS